MSRRRAAPRPCLIPGCERRDRRRGLCPTHAYWWANRGFMMPLLPRKTFAHSNTICRIDDCPMPTKFIGLCSVHYDRQRPGRERPAGDPVGRRYVYAGSLPRAPRVNGNGYVEVHAPGRPGAHSNGWALCHRVVMEERLGRQLRPDETVHHRNGNKADNRFENLEIWVSYQPRGQRPADLVEYAREILRRYELEVAA